MGKLLSMIEGARARGLDVTTEAYPYIAGMTAINSALPASATERPLLEALQITL